MRAATCLKVFNDDIYKVGKGSVIKDGSEIVSDFYWSSSRKSYLPCGQSYDVNSYEAIRQCLRAGARLINLDVHYDGGAAVVTNNDEESILLRSSFLRKYYSTPLNFERCLEVVGEGISETNPLILYLEFHFNDEKGFIDVRNKINKVYNGGKLLNSYVNGEREVFGNIPIRKLMGKIAIIVNKEVPLLGEIVNGVVTYDLLGGSGINSQIYNKNSGLMISSGGSSGGSSGEMDGVSSGGSSGVSSRGSSGGSSVEKKFREYNRNNLRIIDMPNYRQIMNIYKPKSDLYNPNPVPLWNYGCQFVLMNFQLKDKNLEVYLNKFRNSSLVLKENRKERKIPKKVIKQSISLDKKSIKKNGWYDIQF